MDSKTRGAEMTMTTLALFETTTCSRCGGSGRYSFNQIDGNRCYGCGGTGHKFTKRGAAARQAWIAAWTHTKPVSEFAPGEKMVVIDHMRGNRRTVLTVSESKPDDLNPGRWMVRFGPGGCLGSHGFISGDNHADLPASRDDKRNAYAAIMNMPGAVATMSDWDQDDAARCA